MFLILTFGFIVRGMLPSTLPVSEYAARRERVLKELNGGVGVVYSGDHAGPSVGRWKPDLNFFYLTGLDTESGAALLFDPSAEDPKKRIVLFLRPLNTEVERWDGYRHPIGAALRTATGFDTIMRSGSLPAVLTAAAKRTRQLACLLPFATYPAPVSADLAVFQQISQRVPGVRIEDKTGVLPNLRAIKSKGEIDLIERAIEATVAGYLAIIPFIKPGNSEMDVVVALENAYRAAGSTGLAYNSIVGSGFNATVLHYNDNNQPMRSGDLMVIDSAAGFGGYTADVTRTFPVSGKFTSEQRDLYDIVLRSELAAIKAAKPGARMIDVDAAARAVIDKAGYGDAFIHSIGHPLGLQVHDVVPDHPLKAGMVITVEPGIYLPEEKTGIRIEDDLLITAKGNKNLTMAMPKTAADVEALFR